MSKDLCSASLFASSPQGQDDSGLRAQVPVELGRPLWSHFGLFFT